MHIAAVLNWYLHIIPDDWEVTRKKFEKELALKKKTVLESLHQKAMKETLFLKLDRNLASPTESADGGKETIGNTPELTV